MKQFFSKLFRWIVDLFRSGKLRKALETAAVELDELRAAVMSFADQLEEANAKIEKYKKQIKELKEQIKSQDSE